MKTVFSPTKKKSAILAISLLVLSSIFGLSPLLSSSIPRAFAASGIVQQNNGGCNNCLGGSSSFSLAFSSSVTTGSVVVVAIDLDFSSPTVTSVTDSLIQSYSQAVDSNVASTQAYIYYATLSSSASDTITVHLSSAAISGDGYEVNIYELSGVTTAGLNIGSNSGTTSGFQGHPDAISASSTSFQSGAFLLGTVSFSEGNSQYAGVGTGFTFSTSSAVEGYSEYATSGIASPTTFPLTICDATGESTSSCGGSGSGYNWAEAGIALDPIPLTAGAITPSSPTITSGQSVTLTANPSGGTGSYTYQWYSGSSATCSSDTTALGTSSTQLVSPTGNTYYCYSVTDTTPTTATSATDLVTVNPAIPPGPPPPLVDGSVTWTTSYQGFQYIYSASVAINGKQFSATFYESLFAQYQLVPGLPYAGYYSGTFGAISGCSQGATITITATVNGVTKSATGTCPAPGNSTAISLSF